MGSCLVLYFSGILNCIKSACGTFPMQDPAQLKSYLPTKKFLIVFIILVLAGAGAFFYNQKAGSGEGGERNVAGAAKKTDILERLTIDTDMDGLKDWEELLTGADPNKKDTDGDGTEDGEEARAGRNPTVKGPSDFLSEEQKEESLAKEEEAGAEIERVFQTMFVAEIASRKGQGFPGKTASSTLSSIAEKEVAVYSNKVVRTNTYTISNIHTSEETSREAIRAYGNEAGSVVQKNSPVGVGAAPVLLIIYKALSTNSDELLAELDPYIAFYDAVISDLLLVSVPKPTVIIHLNLLNGLSGFHDFLRSMRGIFQDPFAAAAGLKRLSEVLGILGASLNEMNDLFVKNNITFEAGDPGAIFLPLNELQRNELTNIYKSAGIPVDAKLDGKMPPVILRP